MKTSKGNGGAAAFSVASAGPYTFRVCGKGAWHGVRSHHRNAHLRDMSAYQAVLSFSTAVPWCAGVAGP